MAAVRSVILAQTMPPLTTPPWTPPSGGWDNEVFPSPQIDQRRCNQHDPSWLCDPNSMLTKKQCQLHSFATFSHSLDLHGGYLSEKPRYVTVFDSAEGNIREVMGKNLCYKLILRHTFTYFLS